MHSKLSAVVQKKKEYKTPKYEMQFILSLPLLYMKVSDLRDFARTFLSDTQSFFPREIYLPCLASGIWNNVMPFPFDKTFAAGDSIGSLSSAEWFVAEPPGDIWSQSPRRPWPPGEQKEVESKNCRKDTRLEFGKRDGLSRVGRLLDYIQYCTVFFM